MLSVGVSCLWSQVTIRLVENYDRARSTPTKHHAKPHSWRTTPAKEVGASLDRDRQNSTNLRGKRQSW
jgi:hypothetical protein